VLIRATRSRWSGPTLGAGRRLRLSIPPRLTFRALRGDVDTLLVVGGRGVDALLHDLRSSTGSAGWPAACAASVGLTGAFLLAERACSTDAPPPTHWSRAKELRASLSAGPRRGRPHLARDGNLYTSAGVSAGMDLALALIEEDLGAEVALAVARAMVMYLRRPGDQSQYSAPLRLQAAETPSVRELGWPGPPSIPRPMLSCLRSPNASARARGI